MTLRSVLTLIEQVRRQTANADPLRRHMAEKLDALNLVIRIDHPDPVSCLVGFVAEYIELAPRLLQCVEESADQIGRQTLFAPFVAAAQNAFERPSIVLSRYDSLEGLLIKAYLCHRLLEEMCESNRSIRNANLVDIQAAQANLLVHHLIGEPFSNEVDSSILVTVRQLLGSPSHAEADEMAYKRYYELNLAPFAKALAAGTGAWIQDYGETLLSRNHISFSLSCRSPLR